MKVFSTTFTTVVLNSVFLSFANTAVAQVTPDGTTSTTVTPTATGVQIDQGNRAGGNLFHSFGEFSVPTGSEAYFNNANDIVNIFSRVTGGNISNIDGLLRANGTANLFLINPAGILFGPNASLQLGGSFYGSTVDSIVFPDGEFSATDLENPPLITINAPIGLGFRDNPGDIVNQANDSGLSVSAGKTLSLIGGNVNSNTGLILAPGANVWLGGLEEAGTIEISEDNTLTFPENVARGNVSFTNNSFLFVSGADGGSININAKNLEITSGSNFFAGINIDSGSAEAQAGDIIIDLTEDLLIDGAESESFTLITNSNFGTGNAGNIEINARNINFKNGGSISSNNIGRGDIGDITLNAKGDITFDGVKTVSLNGQQSSPRSGIFNVVSEGATGNVGKTNIQAQNLKIINGSQILSAVQGTANSGDINLNVTDTITVDGSGEGINNNQTITVPSNISSSVAKTGTGNSGNINIGSEQFPVKQINLTNGAQISTNIEGQGNAGNLFLFANNFQINGGENGILTGLFAQAAEEATGKGGSIFIGSEQSPVEQINLNNGAQISVSTFSQGDAGNLSLFANNLQIDGGESGFLTGLSASVESGTGKGGSIFIGSEQSPVKQINLNNGAQISVSTFSQGDAGNLALFTHNLQIDGGENGLLTALGASVEPGATGKGGNINIGSEQFPVEQISLNNGARISVSTFGEGNAGNLSIFTKNLVIDGGENGFLTSLEASVKSGATGNAGTLTLGSEKSPIKKINLSNGAQILVNTFGEGDAGILSIFADNLQIDGGENGILTGLFASVESGATGNGGSIFIGSEQFSTQQLTLKNGAQIVLNTFSQGNAGDLSLFANNLNIDGIGNFSSGLFTQVGQDATGNAGTLTLGSEKSPIEQINLSNGARILVNIFGEGDAGTLSIFASNLEINGGENGILTGLGASVELGATGKGGSIFIGNEQFSTQQLTLKNGAQIIANTFSQGNAGDLFIFANNLNIDGIGKFPSGLFAEVGQDATGDAGDVNVTSSNLTIANGAAINVNSKGQGLGGNLVVNTDNLNLNLGSLSASTGFGQGGNITLEVADNVILRNNSLISAQASNEASGGNINIDTDFIIAYPSDGDGNDIIASADQGKGGKIDITAEGVLNIEERKAFENNGTNDIDATSGIEGLGGTVTINTPDNNPIRENTQLSQNVVTSTVETTDTCSVSETGEVSGLVVKGKGGVTPEPTETISADALIVDEEATSNLSQNNNSQLNPEEIPPHIQPVAYKNNGEPIYLARGVIVQEDGTLILTAYPTDGDHNSNSIRTPQPSGNCSTDN